MRLYMTTILALFLCATLSTPARADRTTVSYLSQIAVSKTEVAKEGKNVKVDMRLDLSQLRMRRQHSLALTPVIVSADGTQRTELPPLVIDGKVRNRVYRRAQIMPSVDMPPYHTPGQAVNIVRSSKTLHDYTYEAFVPYERWMIDGRVLLTEKVHGCVNCPIGTEEQNILGNILPLFVPQWQTGKLEPEPEPIKVRGEKRTARLHLSHEKNNNEPKLRRNKAELATGNNSINLVKNDPDITITKIHITGYASPEATMRHNQKLSENRAKALAEYISRHDSINLSMLQVTGKGEDWVGFLAILDSFPNLERKDDVKQIIQECGGEQDDRDACERRIKALSPDLYKQLMNEVYPMLRRNEYLIEYNVDNFSLEQARSRIIDRPDLLSLKEIYMVAGSYTRHSEEYNYAMQMAAKYYPNSAPALNDRALDALSQGKHAEAAQMLITSPLTQNNPMLQNTLGVALANCEKYEDAKKIFSRAAETGSEQAKHNLSQVEKILEQL